MNYGYGTGMPWSYGNPPFTPVNYGGYGTFPFTGGYGTTPFAYGGYGPYPYGAGYGFGAATDDEIGYFVEQALDNDPAIPAHVNIDVDVQNGVVTLTGTVPNKRIKHAAGDDAWWLPQVQDVHNEIEVVSRKERVGMGETTTASTSVRAGRTASR